MMGTDRMAVSVLLALALCACNAAPPPGADRLSEEEARSDQGALRPEEDRVSRIAPKPTAPIAIDYEPIDRPVLGEPLAVTVTVVPQVAMDGFRVQFQTDRGLTLSSAPVVEHGTVAANQVLTHTVMVTPLEEGRWYIGVLAEGETAGGPQARNGVIPIQIGAAARVRESSENLKSDDSGERVISLPAEERR